ncbi:protein CANDIDATE G-PROTEIN COUPLED RECEPTOR 7-like [Trifolium pratense]|uniref:protein CANDIDATE G-PROTEIN COUPLED RECEPTOR 7-like n=1 Tax=Trifolium pratense TaxID=57577 RepID=UPI001E6947BF|nr:protein CANDIDATE G-PROTEIN COUPLED RECEPTOR 7-like [Trifolium pratense]
MYGYKRCPRFNCHSNESPFTSPPPQITMWKPYIPFFLLLFSTILFLSPTTTTAEIKSLTINFDTRPMIFFEKFGFTPKGRVTISVSSVVLSSSSQLEFSHLGFFLLNDENLLQVLTKIKQNASFCVLDYRYIYPLFTFGDISPPPPRPPASFNRSFPVLGSNEYSLFFANCDSETSVSMVVRTEIFNFDSNGSRDYLSAGQTQLPSLFFLFFVAYLAFFVVWVYTCYIYKHLIHRIHLLMAVLLLMKGLNLICAAEHKHYVKVTGLPHGWNLWFYIFQFIHVVLLFSVLVLIGAGWSFLKPSLQDREKKVLMIVIPLQVLANLTSAVIGDTDPFIKDWVTWNQVFLLVDIICCCAIIFPIVWSIRSLRETLKTDGNEKVSRNLAKLILFKQFYIVIIGYLCFTRIVVFALRTIAAYKYQWISNAAEETASFVFFIVMFYMFRPVEKNECFILDQKEEEDAEIALRNESFCLRNFEAA